jgi:hypothetical protein
MPTNLPDPRLADLAGDPPEQPGAVAARCRHLADQLAGGPVRDALLAMARDYTRRALDTARAAPFRLELERHERDDTALKVFAAFDRFVDNVRGATARASLPPVATAQHAAPVVAATQAVPQPTVSPRRASRLYRIHALQTLR